jgi:hypothetical protein
MNSFHLTIQILERVSPSYGDPCYVSVTDASSTRKAVSYQCLLCGHRAGSDYDSLEQHKAQPYHRQQVEQFKSTLCGAVSILRNFDQSQGQGALDRMEKLGLSAWRNSVGAAFLSHMTSNLDSTNRQQPLFTRAMQTLVKYERLERLALLELAIWKAECLNRMPDIKDDYSKAVSWMKSGWKTLKEELRGSSAIAIIISLVLPYTETLA